MTETLEDFLADVAWCYELLEHRPTMPVVRYTYHALTSELWKQYLQVHSIYRVRFADVDPYPTCWALFEDMDASHLSVYRGSDMPTDHPLYALAPNGETYNSIFRAVHDALAHYPERNDFTYRGEFKAFRAHCRLLSSAARHALATETLAQNAWLHFGPHAHLPLSVRPFADQKADILPSPLIRKALTIHV